MQFKELSTHGGDEDWVLHCPNDSKQCSYPIMIDDIIAGTDDYFDGFGHAERHELSNGDVVVIFAHA